jgi:hypothetical protein
MNSGARSNRVVERDLFVAHVPARRSPLSVAISLTLHGGFIAAVMLLTVPEFVPAGVQIRRSLTFVRLSPPPLPIEEIEPLRVPEAAKPVPVPIVEALEPPPVPEPVKPARQRRRSNLRRGAMCRRPALHRSGRWRRK